MFWGYSLVGFKIEDRTYILYVHTGILLQNPLHIITSSTVLWIKANRCHVCPFYINTSLHRLGITQRTQAARESCLKLSFITLLSHFPLFLQQVPCPYILIKAMFRIRIRIRMDPHSIWASIRDPDQYSDSGCLKIGLKAKIYYD
jgi:hypothetical protein